MKGKVINVDTSFINATQNNLFVKRSRLPKCKKLFDKFSRSHFIINEKNSMNDNWSNIFQDGWMDLLKL
jgi:hypothetical protein